ncbi:MAG TPA: hypothetical protein VIT92_05800 [Burkholderiaceae bacterium]
MKAETRKPGALHTLRTLARQDAEQARRIALAYRSQPWLDTTGEDAARIVLTQLQNNGVRPPARPGR